ncbi:MAG TPA: FG-GAP-like repeat-containing protein [Vicinamibacterales bacterium]|nr:FG-GAP-like repeat-containing protein [Vicinamibacterales bacterium]
MNASGAAAAAIVAAALAAAAHPTQDTGRQTSASPVAVREEAHRANNRGVAYLEQFDFPAAVTSFRRALDLLPGLGIARLNLAIARFYAGEMEPARREAEAARANGTTRLHADYMLGLIARSQNRTRDAIEAFARVHRADPDDVGSAVNLGQLYTQEQKFAEAIELFRRATQLEPYNSSAAYGLATALLRSGARDEGAATMERFQQLRESGYATSYSQVYLEEGRYAAAIASTGAEPGIVDAALPAVTFADVTSTALPGGPSGPAGAVTLADVDADGDLDLIAAAGGALRLFRNDTGRFSDGTSEAGLADVQDATAALCGDYDNDERPDLFVLSPTRPRLFQQQAGGRFAEVTDASLARALETSRGARTAAWLDADHDGDLDLLVPPLLLRNNGNGTFVDIAAAAGLVLARDAVAVAPVDYDNRRDIDVLVAAPAAGPRLMRNMRDGSFVDAAAEARLGTATDATCIAVGDVNKDGFADAFFCRGDAPGTWALSDGRGHFALSDADAVTRGADAAQFVDYDVDGLLDLVAVTPEGVRVVRNAGTTWMDGTRRAFGDARGATGALGAMTAGDLDGNGAPDLVTSGVNGIAIWRNSGAEGRRALRVQLSARVSNRSSLGARVEVRAGSLSQQIDTSSATPPPAPADIVFGLGDRAGADVVRVLWPAGILQAEMAAPDAAGAAKALLTGTITVRELDRKPSSCPYLFTWNGSRFEFVSDFLGGGELGYWVAPGVRNTPDPDEYVRIEGRQLQPRQGRYELRVTNELEEAVFLDRVQLVAVAHPEDTEIYPREGMGARPQPFGLYTTRDARPPLSAFDEHGHDVLGRLSALDRAYADDFALEPIRGYAKPHFLTLTLPPRAADARVLLLLTGWTDYAFSRDNVAASQAGLRLSAPSLEVRGPDGRWRAVIENIGVPVGRPQTVPVDLSGVLPPGATEIRISTAMRIYWDRILVDTAGLSAPSEMVRLDPLAAALHWRGFSAEVSPDGREPFGYDYARPSPTSPWKLMPGRYTREGDVRELLTQVDDMFVVSRPGDAIELTFDADALPPLRAGWTRTFHLYANGYSKEMDPHSSSPDTLAPLPFRGMSQYPYDAPERYPDDRRHREYVDRYNTRVVTRAVPRVELLINR